MRRRKAKDGDTAAQCQAFRQWSIKRHRAEKTGKFVLLLCNTIKQVEYVESSLSPGNRGISDGISRTNTGPVSGDFLINQAGLPGRSHPGNVDG
jgi:hypothetical protein